MKKLLVILITSCLFFSGCLQSSNDLYLYGTEYKNPPDAPDFTLLNQDGESVTLSDYYDKVVVVAFIYTSCPDICLAISANLAWVHENLGDYSDDVVILSVTIDPARDTVERFSQWTEANGYEWDHLSAERPSTLVNVWNSWNIVVDNEHIEASQPPEESTNRFSVLYPDNTSIVIDTPCRGEVSNNRCYNDGNDFANYAFSNVNITYNLTGNEGDIGEWSTNDNLNFSWLLHYWDNLNETWSLSESQDISSIDIDINTHLAWVSSNSNLSHLLPGVDCNGKGWIMGSGVSAHCMCDEGYERPDGNWLGCIMIGIDDTNSSETVDPHEQSLGEYGVGHSTVTFILDKQTRKRVAWTGINWDVQEFLLDIQALSTE
jgi:cytochrome oxidase Cu insertion factor (SCO1/SenC/PrrC family)